MGGRDEPLTKARKDARAAGQLADDIATLIETLADVEAITDLIGAYNGKSDEFRTGLLEEFLISKPRFANFRNGSGTSRTHRSTALALLRLLSGDLTSNRYPSLGEIVRSQLRLASTNQLLTKVTGGLRAHLANLESEEAAQRKAVRHARVAAATARPAPIQQSSGLEARMNGVAKPVREVISSAADKITVPRAAFLRTPTLALLCNGAFASRAEAEAEMWSAYAAFDAARENARSAFQTPVFWIRGRSGDGKSVLLLQLARRLAQETNGAVLLCESPERLVQALGLLSADDREQIVLVVDDLHKVRDESALADAFERATELQLDLTVLTCGPTQERNAFMKSQPAIWSPARHGFKTPDLGHDAAPLATLLGIDISPSNDGAATLVEQVYLALIGAGEGATSLKRFAEGLRDRVGQGGHEGDIGALAQIAAFTWMDVAFPVAHLDPDVRDRVEALSDETQLHFDVNGGEVRFGHPAIARPIFDALSAEPGVPTKIETRLIKAMAPVLKQLDDRSRRRAVRQIKTRLTNETGASVLDVLTGVFAAAGGATVGSAVVALLLPELKGDVDGGRWLSVARSYRQNSSLPPQVRAEIASTLALLKSPHPDDVKWVFENARQPIEISQYLGRGIWRLLSDPRNARYTNWTIEWLRHHPDSREAQNVVVALLANHLKVPGVRSAVLSFIAAARVENLRSTLVAKQVELLEEETQASVLGWLTVFRGTPQAANVLNQLLKKHGGQWLEAALAHVQPGPSGSTWNQTLAASMIRKAGEGDAELQTEMLSAAERWATILMSEPGTGEFFQALTPFLARPEIRALVDRRLTQTWGAPDALTLLGEVWPRVSEVDGIYDVWAEAVCRWAYGDPSASRPVGITSAAARQAFRRMLQSPYRLTSLLPTARLAMLNHPDDGHHGRLAGQLLKHLARARVREAGDSRGDEAILATLEPDASEYRSRAWSAIGSANPDEVTGALTGLIHLADEQDLPELSDAVRRYLARPVRRSSIVLSSWIRGPATEADALRFILDGSLDTEAQNKLRANALAHSISVCFRWIQSEALSDRDVERLGTLLGNGVADANANPASAWALLQLHEQWPDSISRHLWSGVLRASLEGQAIRRDYFWHAFEPWYKATRDAQCKAVLESVGLA